MFVLWKVKLFCIAILFSSNMCVQPEVVNRNPRWKVVNRKSLLKSLSSFKSKSWSHFLEEIFRPTDSKSLRLRSAAFGMQASHGVWGSPSKCPTTVSMKPVSSLLRGRTKTIVHVTQDFFPVDVNAKDRLCKLWQNDFL